MSFPHTFPFFTIFVHLQGEPPLLTPVSLDIYKHLWPSQGRMSPVQPLCVCHMHKSPSLWLSAELTLVCSTSRDSLIHSRVPMPSCIPYLPSSTYYGGSSRPSAKACHSDAFSRCLEEASSTCLFLRRWSAAETC